MRQTWTNFLFNPGTFQWDAMAIGPDADDKYAIPPPPQVWYLPNLLVSWQSDLFGDGVYDFSLELFNAGGMPIPIASGNSLRLFVVNTPPVPVINDILYNGTPVCACAIVNQGADPSGFTFNLSVTDARGALNAFSLGGIFGVNQSTGTIYSDSYSSHMNEDGPERWTGVTNIIVPKVRFRAKQSCAYSFILSASSRSQNGYGLIFPNLDYHISLTILLSTGAGSITGCTTIEQSAGPTGSEPAGVSGGVPPAAASRKNVSLSRRS